MSYDIVIMMAEKNIGLLGIVTEYIKKNLNVNRIITIGNEKLKTKCEKYECKFIDEDQLYEDLTFQHVNEIISERNIFIKSITGWYYQQFLKMAYSAICKDEFYLVWDADLIPLRRLVFFESGKPFFDVKTEYLPSYFCTLGKLFQGRIKKEHNYSYISEHMLIKTSFMREIIEEIENDDSLLGKVFFEKILNTIRFVDLPANGFSEYETYGSYVEKKYPGFYQIRRLETLREGDIFLGIHQDEKSLEWASNSFDTICFENKVEQIRELAENWDYYYNNFSLDEVVERFKDYIIYT